MDELKMFRVINRLNSILFLILLLGGIGSVLFFTVQVNGWSNKRTVQVAEKPKDKGSPKIELVLGSVKYLEGHETQYVELSSKSRGSKFSSGYGGGETRNILFLVGEDLQTRWLFENHSKYIKRVSPIRKYDADGKISEVIAIFYEFVGKDSNNNKLLDREDLFNIALTYPDGSGFSVLETGVSSVIDITLSKNGNNFSVLYQKEGSVHLKNYNPKTFELKNTASILEIGSGA